MRVLFQTCRPVDRMDGGAAGRHAHGGGVWQGRPARTHDDPFSPAVSGCAVSTTTSWEALGGPDAPWQSHAAAPSVGRVLGPEARWGATIASPISSTTSSFRRTAAIGSAVV